MDTTKFVKFIHRQTGNILYSPTEFIIDLEFENKKFLWDLPKDTMIKCVKYTSNENNEEIVFFPLSVLKLSFTISYDDINIEYIETK